MRVPNTNQMPRYYFNKKFGVRIRLCLPAVLPSYVPKLNICQKCGTPKTLYTCFAHLVRTTARGRHHGGGSFYSFECKVCKLITTRRNKRTPAGRKRTYCYNNRPDILLRCQIYRRAIRPLVLRQKHERYWMRGWSHA